MSSGLASSTVASTAPKPVSREATIVLISMALVGVGCVVYAHGPWIDEFWWKNRMRGLVLIDLLGLLTAASSVGGLIGLLQRKPIADSVFVALKCTLLFLVLVPGGCAVLSLLLRAASLCIG